MSKQAEVSSLLRELGLPAEEILELVEGNPSAALPYHNNKHNYSVAYHAYTIAQEMLIVSESQAIHLLVAGLFHDYGHTGEGTPDLVNVEQALQAITNNQVFFRKAGLSPWLLRKLIHSTLNPAVGNYDVLERIIRDADLLGWTEPDISSQLAGLSAELGTPVTEESTKVFLQQATIYTFPARRKLVNAGWLTR